MNHLKRGLLLICSLQVVFFAPVGLPAGEIPAEIASVLELCAGSALLSAEELQGATVQVEAVVQKLEKERRPEDKVWLFRLRRCQKFLEFRLEANAARAADPPQE